jgi:lysophospholipase L1-like esterase
MSTRTTSARILALAAVNAAVLGVGLVVLELIFGGWVHAGRLDGLNLICDTAIEYRLHGLYPSDSDTALYTRDAWCLRGGPDRAGEIDLLTMGGSTTDQRYIADGATWQDVLQEELRRSGSPVRVANAGVDGQSTYGHLESLEHWLPAIDGLRPRWILFYVGVNDLFKSADFADDRLLDEPDPTAPLHQRLKRVIRKRSALYQLYRTVRGVVRAHAYGLDHRYADPFAGEGWVEAPLVADPAGVLAPQREAYARRLRRLCERTRALGATPIFVTQPSRVFKLEGGRIRGTAKTLAVGDLRFNGVDYYRFLEVFNATTLEVARECGAQGLDLAKELAFDPEADFYDRVHNTPSGARRIGRYLYAKLRPVLASAEGRPDAYGRAPSAPAAGLEARLARRAAD